MSKQQQLRNSVACVVLSVPVLAGCSTVKSIDLSKSDVKDRKDAYLNYSVAKSVLVIQVASAAATTQAPVTAAPSAFPSATPPVGGGAVQPPVQPGAAAAQPPPGTNTQSAASNQQTSNTPPLLVDSSECAVWTAEYTAAQTLAAGEISSYGTLTTRLIQLINQNQAQADSITSLSGDLAAYMRTYKSEQYRNLFVGNDLGVASDGRVAASAGMYSARALYNRIVKNCPPKVTVTVQQTVVPDTTRTFALKPETNVLYTDNLTIGTDSNGFLTNGNPVSTSNVTAIAGGVASDIGLGFGVPVVGGPAVAHVPYLQVPIEISTDPDKLIAALAGADSATSPGIATQLLEYLPHPATLRNLPAATLPLTMYATIEDFEPQTGVDRAGRPEPLDETGKLTTLGYLLHNDYQKPLKELFALRIGLQCSPRDVVPDDGFPENVDSEKPAVYDGLVVSGSRACRARAQQERPGLAPTLPTSVLIAQNYFWMQDSRYLAVLPTRRGFLVPRSVAYSFSGGQATGVVDSRPSEALAFVSFPGSVAGQFFAGVTSAFTNANTLTTDKTTAITAQTSLLTAQAMYLAAQATLQKARASAPAN